MRYRIRTPSGSGGLGIVVVLAVMLTGVAPGWALDRAAADRALDAVSDDRWAEARALAYASGDPLVSKLVLYFDAVHSRSTLPFSTRAAFIDSNPDWPRMGRVRQFAESAMPETLPSGQVVDWFQRHPPLTGYGQVRFAEALKALGADGQALQVARNAWHTERLSANLERRLIADFGDSLTSDDHVRRLDGLLWQGRRADAERMMSRVNADWKALARARIALRGGSGNASRTVAAVPPALRNHPGLVYERVRQLRKRDRNADARALINGCCDAAEPDRWWQERAILARRALSDGLAQEAYRMASGHQVGPDGDLADAEFLSGWIALRFLDQPGQAQQHFQRLYEAVSYPISLARGAYWLGRAHAEGGDSDLAEAWFKSAAAHPSTYYGQLAALSINGQRLPAMPADPRPTASEVEDFENHELTRAVRLLDALGETRRVGPFVIQLSGLRPSPGWKALAGTLAASMARPDLAVFVAKDAYKSREILVDLGYPQLPLPRITQSNGQALERAFVLGLIRQESAFRITAVSSAGARGLMQLMPGTAQLVSRQLAVPYQPSALTRNTGYNLKLGQRYLADQLDRFDGSKVLALCAYNAGPNRAVRWKRERGDPHTSLDRAIDWVELIPFRETRNYVQRVLENLQVYRAKAAAAGAPTGRTLVDDLTGR